MKQIITFLIVLLLMSATSFAQVNYIFASSGETFTEITGTAFTSWLGTTPADEGYTGAENIGFTFNYAGTAFTQFQVSSNGFLRFGTGLASATPADALSGTLRSVIAPLWNDLQVSATSDITYELSGSSGSYVLTVEWLNVKWNKSASSANARFQIKLYQATGVIEFVYGTMGTPNAGSASIGLADNTTISTAGSATGKFLSINVGGSGGSRVYHQSRAQTFNGINNAPDSNTKFTFTPVTPSPIATGTYAIGGGSPTYNSLSEAAQALTIHGVTGGPVVLEIANGTYDDIFHVNEISGSSSSNTVTLKPATGATVTISPRNGNHSTGTPDASTGDAIIRLTGTDYVTVTNLSLTQNAGNTTATTKFNMGVLLSNSVLNGTPQSGSQYNTLANLVIDMGGTDVTAGLIGIQFRTAGTTTNAVAEANSHNTIRDVNITGFHANAIKMFGHSVNNRDTNNVITAVSGRNTLGNISSGIASDVRTIEMDCQAAFTVEKTDITSIASNSTSNRSFYGIVSNVDFSASNLNGGEIIICNNTISGINLSGYVAGKYAAGIALNSTSTGTVYRIYNNRIYDLYSADIHTGRTLGIYIFAAPTTDMKAYLHNNMISDLRAPAATTTNSTFSAVLGVAIYNGGGNGVFYLYHNTIRLGNENGATPTSATHRSASIYWTNFSSGTLDLRNNIIINLQDPGSSGTAACLHAGNNDMLLRLAKATDHNLYYVGTSGTTRGIGYNSSTMFQDIASYKAAVASGGLGGPRDVNAKSAAVTFTSVTDLHLSGGSVGDYTNLIGQSLSSPYNVDIDGDARDGTYPYIGADEVSSSPLPVQLSAFTATVNGLYPELRWTTETEINNYGFEIERASNGTWKNIGFVEGAGNSNAPRSYTFVDASAHGAVQYRLKQIDRDGSFEYSSIVEANVVLSANDFSLAQNYPNPFNPATTISFVLPMQTKATVKVYNTLGQTVATVFDEIANAGYNEVSFNASQLPSGIYFYSLNAGSFSETRKMMLMK